jgi:hypothetical protein
MFEQLKLARQIFEANRLAHRIVLFLEPSLIFCRDSDGSLDLGMQTDEFVLAYIYGVIRTFVASAGAVPQGEPALTARQVFDRLFPRQGGLITELCTLRVNEKDKNFVTTMEVGSAETSQAITSPGQVPLGLQDYTLTNYRRVKSKRQSA